MHTLSNRITIALITAFLSTIGMKGLYWDTIEPNRLWYVFSLFALIILTYGLLASYIIEWIENRFKTQILRILIRILLYIIVAVIPFIGSQPLMVAGIISAVFYVLVDALYPQPKK